MYKINNIDLKMYLDALNLNDFLDKLEQFRSIDFRSITEQDLAKEIENTISVNLLGGKLSVLLRSNFLFNQGTRLYRVRKINADNWNIPFKDMMIKTDAWNPPSNKITTMGRLNKVSESVLYVSLNAEAAIRELKIKEGEKIALIVYESKKNINAVGIGVGNSYDDFGLSEDEKAKIRFMDRFLCDEFTKDVGLGTEFLYKISKKIATDYFDLPLQDAWLYQSVASKQDLNLCFKPEIALKKLRLIGVLIAEFINEKLSYKFVLHGYDATGKFKYHSIRSEIQKEIFPDLSVENSFPSITTATLPPAKDTSILVTNNFNDKKGQTHISLY